MMSIDHRFFAIFDTDKDGAESFAEAYAGIPITEFVTDRTRLKGGGTWAETVEGMPLWDLSKIKNGRFFSPSGTNGWLSVDMDTYRVYVFD